MNLKLLFVLQVCSVILEFWGIGLCVTGLWCLNYALVYCGICCVLAYSLIFAIGLFLEFKNKHLTPATETPKEEWPRLGEPQIDENSPIKYHIKVKKATREELERLCLHEHSTVQFLCSVVEDLRKELGKNPKVLWSLKEEELKEKNKNGLQN